MQLGAELEAFASHDSGGVVEFRACRPVYLNPHGLLVIYISLLGMEIEKISIIPVLKSLIFHFFRL